jgi:hypothetical protein
MSKHDRIVGEQPKRSFKATSLKLDPSLITIACYLARIAAEDDFEAFKKSRDSYNSPEAKGGPS